MEQTVDEISGIVVDAAYHLHVGLGPGLLESVYQCVLARDLARRGMKVEPERLISFEYDGMRFDNTLRVDLLIEDSVVVELKSVERLEAVHSKQLLTYLKLLDLRVGLLINFGAPTFKDGIKRVVNNHHSSAAPRLRVRQEDSEERQG